MPLRAPTDVGQYMPPRPTTLHTPRPRWSGFVLWDGRRGGFCWDQKPRCVGFPGEAEGHALKTRQPLPYSDTIVRCTHQVGRQGPECNTRLFVAPLTTGTADRCWLVVEITEEHIQRMQGEPMIFLQRLALIDVALPGVQVDLEVRGITTPEDSR